MKGGKIGIDGMSNDRRCFVIDVSAGGAQIELPAVSRIPSEFTLTFDGDSTYDCFVKWRKARRIGVAFLPAQAARLSR